MDKKEKFNAEIFNFLPIAIGVMDMKGKILSANKKFFELFGYEVSKIYSLDDWFALAYPNKSYRNEVIKTWEKDINEVLNINKKVPARTYQITCKNKTVKTVEIGYEILHDKIIVSFIDVTSNIKTEKALIESEKNFRELAEKSPNMIFINQNGKVVFANNICEKIIGYAKEELYSDEFDFFNLIEEEYRGLIYENYKKHQNGIDVPPYEYKIKTKNGKTLDVIINTKLVNYNNSAAILGIVTDISDRKNIETALKKSELNLAESLKIAKLAHWEYEVAKNRFIFNDQFYNIFKTTVEEEGGYEMLPEEYAKRFLHPDDQHLIAVEMEKAMYSKDPNFGNKLEHRIIYKTGETGYISVNYFVVKDEKGKTIKTYGVNQDITERIKTEKAFIESEKKFRRIFESSKYGIAISNPGFIFIDANPFFCEMFGYTIDEIKNLSFANITSPDFLDESKANMALLKQGKIKQYSTEKKYVKKNGEVFWGSISTAPVLGPNEEILYYIALVQDIDEHKKAEVSLQEERNLLRTIVDNLPIALYIKDKEAKKVIVNSIDLRNIGKPYDEVIGKNDLEVLPKKIAKLTHADDLKIIKTGKPLINREEFITNSKGESRWLLTTKVPRKNKEGKTIGIVGMGLDITERKKAEENLIQSEEKFKLIFNSSNDAITIIDMKGKYIEVNDATIKRYGYTRGEFLKMTPLNILNSEYKKDFKNNLEIIRNKGEMFIEVEHITKNGSVIPTELMIKKILLHGKEAIISISRDISERKMNQQKILNAIIQTEEQERGRIASDLHDGVAPILSTIKLYAQTLKDIDDKHTRKNIIENLQKSTEEAISSLSEISRNISPHVLRNLGLLPALDSFISKLKTISAIKISIISNYKGKLDEKIEIILYRIITEMINNTIKHAKAKNISIRLVKDDYLSVYYSDDGKGFNMDKLNKPSTGMGLFNIKNRVHSINGKIFIESKKDIGVIIKIFIPLK